MTEQTVTPEAAAEQESNRIWAAEFQPTLDRLRAQGIPAAEIKRRLASQLETRQAANAPSAPTGVPGVTNEPFMRRDITDREVQKPVYVQKPEGGLKLMREVDMEILGEWEKNAKYIIKNKLKSYSARAGENHKTALGFVNQLDVNITVKSGETEYKYNWKQALKKEAGRFAARAGVGLGVTIAVGSLLGIFTGGSVYLPAVGGLVGRVAVEVPRMWSRLFGKGKELRLEAAKAIQDQNDRRQLAAQRLRDQVELNKAAIAAGYFEDYPKFIAAARALMDEAGAINPQVAELVKNEKEWNKQEKLFAFLTSLGFGIGEGVTHLLSGLGHEGTQQTAQELARGKLQALTESGTASNFQIHLDGDGVSHAIKWATDTNGAHAGFHPVLNAQDFAANIHHYDLTTTALQHGGPTPLVPLEPGVLHLTELNYDKVLQALTDQMVSKGSSWELAYAAAQKILPEIGGTIAMAGAGSLAGGAVGEAFLQRGEASKSLEGKLSYHDTWKELGKELNAAEHYYNPLAPTPTAGTAGSNATGTPETGPATNVDWQVDDEYEFIHIPNYDFSHMPGKVKVKETENLPGSPAYRIKIDLYKPGEANPYQKDVSYTFDDFRKLLEGNGIEKAKRIFRKGEPQGEEKAFLEDDDTKADIAEIEKYSKGKAKIIFNKNVDQAALQVVDNRLNKDVVYKVDELKLKQLHPEIVLKYENAQGKKEKLTVNFRDLWDFVATVKGVEAAAEAAKPKEGEKTEDEQKVEDEIKRRITAREIITPPPRYKFDIKQAYEIGGIRYAVTQKTESDITLQTIRIQTNGNNAGQYATNNKGFVELDTAGETIVKTPFEFAHTIDWNYAGPVNINPVK